MAQSVVVVDDSKFLVKQIVDFFQKDMGFDVLATGSNGDDAVELYRQHKPDLITLDITMPNKDGQQALKEILTDFPDANIVMISAVRGDSMLECMEIGAKAFIEKPLKFNDAEFVRDFRESVKEALE